VTQPTGLNAARGDNTRIQFRFERDQYDITIRAGLLEAKIRLHRLDLPGYRGPQPAMTWRKPVVGPPARPFAELQIVDGLEADGWKAAWVHRPGKFLSMWEPRVATILPSAALELHDRICEEGSNRAGCWDVFAWRDGVCLFAELKRGNSSDRVRKSQLLWRESALRLGVPSESFAIIEWHGGLVQSSLSSEPNAL
jgi:hypothetical protein